MLEGDDLRSAEISALAAGIPPKRYERNMGTLGPDGQRRLLESAVVVVGLGGLGGHVVESLARLGIGRIQGVDKDIFEESNFNRQLFASEETLGQSKAEAARERVRLVNPAVAFTGRQADFREMGPELLSGLSVAFDCLDDIPSRRELSARCSAAGVPLVHGAIAGWCGQVAVCPPGAGLLEEIYGCAVAERGVETRVGNLGMTAAVAANIMVAAAVPILLGGKPEARVQRFDLSDPAWSRL